MPELHYRHERQTEEKQMDYEDEVGKLKKKLIIFALVSVAFTVLFRCTMADAGFFENLFSGVLFGLIFYIPGRLQQLLHLGIWGTIIISVGFILLVLWLNGLIGDIAFIVIFLPLADICYSIYKVVKLKKENPPEEK